MPTIDDKVVAASFESSKFESGVSKTLSAIGKLKNALTFQNAGKGLEQVSAAAGRVNLSHISDSIDSVKDRLSAFRLTAIAVFAQIASRAISAGAQFAKSFTLGPLIQGFQEYSTNLNSVQTILANTEASGATLKDVNSTLQELNTYSDKTIYNFGQMARNIGTFTAAGVDLKTSTASIKGIANLAALSGSNAEQASTAMYQLSQAISAGRVGLQDWNSVVNAGMGGTVFQRALAQTAEAMGTIEKGAVKLTGPMKNVSIHGESFRQSMQAKPGKQSWLTSKVLTTTLKQFTGDLTDAELKAQGFTDAQIMAIQQTAKTAQHAATEVKTISQVFDVAKETAGSGWAQTFQIIFGTFTEAKTTFTAMSNAINGLINASSAARNKILADWKALGGRTVLIDSIRTAFHNLGLILKPIKEAFRDIFPATTGRDLYDLTKRFQDFAEAIKPSPETIENLRRTFRGLFALMDIGRQIIHGFYTIMGRLLGATNAGSGGILSFTGNVGDFLVSLDKALRKGDAFHKFFVRLGDILATPIRLFAQLRNVIANFFADFSPGAFSGGMDQMTRAMTPFEKVMRAVSDLWDHFVDSVSGAHLNLQPIFNGIIDFVQKIGPAIGQAASTMNFEAILDVIRTGLLAGLVVMLKQFFGKGSLLEQLGGAGGGILGNISGAFSALEGSMKAMQTNIKADTLQKIAIAIALLTASVVALSFVDPDKLKASITAMGFMFGELLGAMAILDKIGKSGGFIKMPFIAGAMILFAGAIDILAIAVIALGKQDIDELKKGLVSVGILLASVSAASIPLSKNSAGMVRAGIGITAIAVAMKILASAVKDFAGMTWTELAKGLSSVAAALGAIAAGMRVMPKNIALTGVGLLAVGAALKIIASAVKDFAVMDWKTMGRGLAGVAGALTGIAVAMRIMPKNMIVIGLGLLAVSLSLQKIVDAVQSMAGMTIEKLRKGLIGLAGALSILAISLEAMTGTVGGAIALGIAAASLSLFIPPLILLGKQPWRKILTSLIALGGALVVLGVSAALLTPVIPALLGLGAALVLIGVGMAGVGAGIFLISTGISALAVAGPTGIGILIAALIQFTKALPELLQNVVVALLAMVRAFAKTAPQFVDALLDILDSLIDAVIKFTPKLVRLFGALITAVIKILHDNQGRIIQAGLDLLLSLLKGIRDNIGKVVTVVVDIITRFLNSIADNLRRIIDAGANILVSLISGIASGITRIAGAVLGIITAFINAITNNLVKIATAGLSILTKLLGAIADHIGDAIKAGTNVIVKFLEGITSSAIDFITTARKVMVRLVNALATQLLLLADGFASTFIRFLNGVAKILETREPEVIRAMAGIALAIIKGLAAGLSWKAAKNIIQGAIDDLADHIPKRLRHLWGIKSPSLIFAEIGSQVVAGLAKGIDDHAKDAFRSAEILSYGVINSVNNIFKNSASGSGPLFDIGQLVGGGFAAGLRGSLPEVETSANKINDAFVELYTKVKDSITSVTADIVEKNKKLTDLQNSKQTKENSVAIATLTKEIYAQYDVLHKLNDVRTVVTTKLTAERIELNKLSVAYDKKNKQLETEKQNLDALTQARKSALDSYTNEFNTLPSLVTEDAEGNPVDQLATYRASLAARITAVGAFKATLDQLRTLGLDDVTYKKLLEEGTADQQFADQLLAGGKTAVESLNTLDKQLLDASTTLATNSANNLFNVAITAKQGLVNGLDKDLHKISAKMEQIGDLILNTLKRKLREKSPSEAMAEIGRFAIEGLIKGLSDASGLVTIEMDKAANNALSRAKKLIRDMSATVYDEMDPNPVITPVLDLTQIRGQARELGALNASITPTASQIQAQQIAFAHQRVGPSEEAATAAPVSEVKFEQNNYSPEALSDVEIYRQTRNQLSQLKAVLAPA